MVKLQTIPDAWAWAKKRLESDEFLRDHFQDIHASADPLQLQKSVLCAMMNCGRFEVALPHEPGEHGAFVIVQGIRLYCDKMLPKGTVEFRDRNGMPLISFIWARDKGPIVVIESHRHDLKKYFHLGERK